MTVAHHPESCSQACGFAAEVEAGRVQPHERGAPIEVDGAADLPQGLTLHVTIKDGDRRPVPITSAVFRVGRGPDNDLQIPVPPLSRRHCEFVVDDGQVFLRDLGSGCGTFVNGARISSRTMLHHGDTVWLANVKFELEVARRTES